MYYQRALTAYEQAIRLDPNYAPAYYNKGDALLALKRREDALTAYEQVTRLDPYYILAYFKKGIALLLLGRSKDLWQYCKNLILPLLGKLKDYMES